MKRIKNVLIFFLAMVMLGACRDKKSEKKEEENIQQENTFVNPLKTEGAQCWANYYDGCRRRSIGWNCGVPGILRIWNMRSIK